MRRIAIYPNRAKPNCGEELARLTNWLHVRGLEVRVAEPAAGGGEPVLRRDELQDADLLIVLGGDGTVLAAARMVYPLPVPVLGVNFGSLGFLAEATVETMLPTLERVLAGEGTCESRLMLRASTATADGGEIARGYALNDLVLRETGGRAVTVEAHVAGTRLGEFRGDGVVIATPTGSTAYSLSAGGPIIAPSLSTLVITPVCPHTLSIRPLVIPATETTEFRIGPPETEVSLTLDGQVALPFRRGQVVRVRRAHRPVNFLRVDGRSFYATVRSKLRWGAA